MVGKFVYALLLVASIAAVSNAAETEDTRLSHHLVIGTRNPYDKLVINESVIKKSSLLRIVKVEKTFYLLNENQRITQVTALDQKTNGKGAHANVVGGGPGHNFVTLKFKSQRGHGISFHVQIHAE